MEQSKLAGAVGVGMEQSESAGAVGVGIEQSAISSRLDVSILPSSPGLLLLALLGSFEPPDEFLDGELVEVE